MKPPSGLTFVLALQHTTLNLEILIEPTRSPPPAAVRAAYKRQIIALLSMSPDLDPFQATVDHVTDLLQEGRLNNVREVEVMLIGGVQVSVSHNHRMTSQVINTPRTTITRYLRGISQ